MPNNVKTKEEQTNERLLQFVNKQVGAENISVNLDRARYIIASTVFNQKSFHELHYDPAWLSECHFILAALSEALSPKMDLL